MPNLKLHWAYKHSLSRAKISNYYYVMVLFCIIKYINCVCLLCCKWIWVKTNLCWYSHSLSFIIVFHKLIISYIYIYIYINSQAHLWRNKQEGSTYKFVWIPIVEQWTHEMQNKFEMLRSTMPWYWRISPLDYRMGEEMHSLSLLRKNQNSPMERVDLDPA